MEVVTLLVAVVKRFAELADSVEVSKTQCQHVAERCSRLLRSIVDLSKRPEQFAACIGTVNKALTTFNHALEMCSHFEKKKYYMKFIFAAAGKKPNFDGINSDITQLCIDLSVEVGIIHSLSDLEQEQEDKMLRMAILEFINSNSVQQHAVTSELEKQRTILNALVVSLNLDTSVRASQLADSDGSSTVACSSASAQAGDDGGWSSDLNSFNLSTLEWSVDTNKVVGKGGFGTVYEVAHAGQRYALKYISFAATPTDRELKKARREALTLHWSRHQNVISFFGADINAGIMVMELAVGSLYDVLFKDLVLPGGDGSLHAFLSQLDVAIDVCSGLQFIHYHDIIHRDIKSQNILFVVNRSGFVAKLSDFGLATAATFTVTASRNSSRGKQAAGSDAYLAPELLDFDDRPEYTPQSDMYALGIVLTEVWTRVLPWEGLRPMQMGRKVCSGSRPPRTPPSPTDEINGRYCHHCIGDCDTEHSCLHQESTQRILAPSLLVELIAMRDQVLGTPSRADDDGDSIVTAGLNALSVTPSTPTEVCMSYFCSSI